jgi:hypothetical protein
VTLAGVIASELAVPLIPYADWLSRIEDASQIPAKSSSFRAPRLLPFFRSINQRPPGDGDAFGFPKLDTVNALRLSHTLSTTGELGEEDVKRWISYWREGDFL